MEIVEKHFAHLPWPKISKEECLARGEFGSLVNCCAARQMLGWRPNTASSILGRVMYAPHDGD
ncbi:MAG: hypothetical protein ACOYYS_19065 [Chloroflexota bacterium]